MAVYAVPSKKPIIAKKGTLKRNPNKAPEFKKLIRLLEENSYKKEDGTVCFPGAKIVD